MEMLCLEAPADGGETSPHPETFANRRDTAEGCSYGVIAAIDIRAAPAARHLYGRLSPREDVD